MNWAEPYRVVLDLCWNDGRGVLCVLRRFLRWRGNSASLSLWIPAFAGDDVGCRERHEWCDCVRASPCGRFAPASPSQSEGGLENLIQKQLRSIFGGVGEDVVGGVDFYKLSFVEHGHAVGYFSCESHFVGYAEHCHAGVGEFSHDVEDFFVVRKFAVNGVNASALSRASPCGRFASASPFAPRKGESLPCLFGFRLSP